MMMMKMTIRIAMNLIKDTYGEVRDQIEQCQCLCQTNVKNRSHFRIYEMYPNLFLFCLFLVLFCVSDMLCRLLKDSKEKGEN